MMEITEVVPYTRSVLGLSVKPSGVRGGEGGTYFWCEANKIVKCSVKFFKDD